MLNAIFVAFLLFNQYFGVKSTETYPSTPPVWFAESEETSVTNAVQILSNTNGHDNGRLRSNSCIKKDIFYSVHHSFNNKDISETKVYILYDINPGEGFNLRRDVYVRLAIFTKFLRQQAGYENTHLVLPPFRRLYHWKSANVDQRRVFWNHFFDLASLKKYTAVLDIWEYFDRIRKHQAQDTEQDTNSVDLDYVLTLSNYENMFENGKFKDKFEIIKSMQLTGDNNVFGYENLTSKAQFKVLYQGSVMLMHRLLEQLKPKFYQTHFSVMIKHAEIVLHDVWGSREYWTARRSMRFNKILNAIADEYRLTRFNSTNESDGVQRPADWLDENSYRNAIGGDYMCAHIRRSDFVLGREKTTPTLQSVANQIKVRLKENNLTQVFISSDCSRSEYKTLKSYLMRNRVHRFQPESIDQQYEIKDGGVAIIDQIVCSHAKYFIGTYESTFTFRIYEEREILGFRKESTFNTFCKSDAVSDDDCKNNSVWLIAY